MACGGIMASKFSHTSKTCFHCSVPIDITIKSSQWISGSRFSRFFIGKGVEFLLQRALKNNSTLPLRLRLAPHLAHAFLIAQENVQGLEHPQVTRPQAVLFSPLTEHHLGAC